MQTSRVVALLLAVGTVAPAQTIVHQPVNTNTITHVTTALNHITLIEFPEPILRAAIGSADFTIEWHGTTVALQPVKQGQATNLFVWTEHTKSSYEIAPPSDVAGAVFVIDQSETKPAVAAPIAAETKVSEDELRKATDLLVSQTLLNSTIIDTRAIKDGHDRIVVKITEVTRNQDGLYIRYTVANTGQHPYRVSDPTVSRFTPATGETAVAAMKGTQITERKVSSLGTGTAVGITVSDARIDNRDLNPGEKSDGVLCIRDLTKNPQLYRFVFPSDQTRPVDAVAVL